MHESARLILICGLPASGKSTLARQLASQRSAMRLDKDSWVASLGGDVWDDDFRELVEAQLWRLAQQLLARGVSVILEWGHWARVERDEKRLAARSMGVPVELHYLSASTEELLRRSQARTAAGEWTAAPITEDHFAQWSVVFQAPDEDELRMFDPPLHDPSEASTG